MMLNLFFYCFLIFAWDASASVSDANTVVAQHNVEVPKALLEDQLKVPVSAQKVPESLSLKELRTGQVQQDWNGRLMGLLGCLLTIFSAFLFSNNRSRISWKLVGIGVVLQFVFAFIVLKSEIGRTIFELANDMVVGMLAFSAEGARFLFGNLIDQNVPVGVASSPMAPIQAGNAFAHTGAIFAFRILPTVIFFSALTAVLYYMRILEWIVQGMAWVMQRTMGASGAESLSTASNIFLGQTEAPLLIRPFLGNMTNSEIMVVMAGGFATVAGGVMAAYVSVLAGYFPDIAGHLIAASVMSAPAALVIGKIMMPEVGEPETAKSGRIHLHCPDANVIDAAARGTADGLMLALNVGAMLIAFIALIAFANHLIASVGGWFGLQGLSLEVMLSWLFSPVAFLLGVPYEDAFLVGRLLGTKTVLNELVAYLHMSDQLQLNQFTHAKSVVIATYALCGFANLGSIGIQIGGLSALAPHRRADFAKIGFRAMVAGSLACFQTAAIAGMLL